MSTIDKIKAVLFGVAVGDALGVPVEFESRGLRERDPVTGMRGGGTFGLPAGTFSDDSSLAFCLAEALAAKPDSTESMLSLAANNFVRWYDEGYWTADGEAFDIGGTTQSALQRIYAGVSPALAGDDDANANGNGSLMRIAPLVFYSYDKPMAERFKLCSLVSSITHRHIRSCIACFYYLEFAAGLLAGKNKFTIYKEVQKTLPGFLRGVGVENKEIDLFDRLLYGDINDLRESEIGSSGYVLDSLEASMWCLLTESTYAGSVLKAVNLGEDTDTTAAITGGLAGLLYGFDNIPAEWVKVLAKHDEIEDLAVRFGNSLIV
jgi:ADP-ribosylglycohydrolase